MKRVRITVVEVKSSADLARVRRIRHHVFIEEQGVPKEIELDSDDNRATHVLAIVGKKAVGGARMVALGTTVKIGRMAVMPQWRRRGVGRALLLWLIKRARREGAQFAILNAQAHAEGFYRSAGFEPLGGLFDEAGIPHRRMKLDLRSLGPAIGVGGNRRLPRQLQRAARGSRDDGPGGYP